ncbi:aldehyde dehydrogenase family protein [Escherichia coli]|nr:aldehyde dehydrogenase family protein [Escherichia coli]
MKRNPVSGEVLWQGNDADAAQVEQACRAARAAFPRWARLSFAERQASCRTLCRTAGKQ